MANRIGVIFHENWEFFSPLLYSHYGGNLLPLKIREYITQYHKKHDTSDGDGHKYEPSHMMAGFIKYLDEDIHMRVENLTESQIKRLKNEHKYPNYFDKGCWIINVSRNNYGKTIKGDIDWVDIGNILKRDIGSLGI